MRYELNFDEDKVNDVLDKGGASYDLKGCCELLNEQQKTIKKQDIEIQSLNLHIKKLVDGDEISQLLMREYEISDGLEKENKELKKQLNKKNTMNMQLREINKELGDDLYNCRLNKNIISEKLKLWQDTLAEYDIYTIKDFAESFELDAKINKEKDEKIKELEVKVLNSELEIKRLEKMIWKIQWRFQQEVGIEKAREHYQEIDKEMEE